MKAEAEERERDESSRHSGIIKIIMIIERTFPWLTLLGIKGSHSRRTGGIHPPHSDFFQLEEDTLWR